MRMVGYTTNTGLQTIITKVSRNSQNESRRMWASQFFRGGNFSWEQVRYGGVNFGTKNHTKWLGSFQKVIFLLKLLMKLRGDWAYARGLRFPTHNHDIYHHRLMPHSQMTRINTFIKNTTIHSCHIRIKETYKMIYIYVFLCPIKLLFSLFLLGL